MPSQLSDVARRWTELGGSDPMWAALTCSGRGGHWNAEGFLRTGRAEIDDVLALLRRRGIEPTAGTALDFGCGPGRLTAALAAGFTKVIGVDVSPTMLAKAREIVPAELACRCEFVLNEGSDLARIPDASVDLVYTCRVLQHMPPALSHRYIREFLRIAAPGAPVVFQIPAEPAIGAIGTALRVLPAAVLDRLRRGMQMHGTMPAEITRLIAEAGGVTVSVEEDGSAGPRWRSYLYVARAKN
ncbi:MAG: class I SAM-dependent methyltransferase [Pseudonocardia sp.]|nr:class I SAM-dependent methyltransferase [Pseudonocardia sp.]